MTDCERPCALVSSFGERVAFRHGLLRGYSPAGAMLLPSAERLRPLAPAALREWCSAPLARVFELALLRLGDDGSVPAATLAAAARDAAAACGAPTLRRAGSVALAELFHTPSHSFKDYGLQLLAAIMSRLEGKRSLLVATSGDTGSAALEAFANRDNVCLTVLFPADRVSATQAAQMTRVGAPNCAVFRLANATSDSIDEKLLNPLLAERQLLERCALGTVNSINIVRIVAQVALYFHLYGLWLVDNSQRAERRRAAASDAAHEPADFGRVLRVVVPTGACGNVTAGVLAAALGLPIEVVAANTEPNSATVQLLANGRFQSVAAVNTPAPAIDITVPYNVERLVALALRRATDLDDATCAARMRQLMADFHNGAFVLDERELAALRKHLTAVSVPVDALIATIRAAHLQHSQLICPHTAVGVAAAQTLLAEDAAKSTAKATLVLATASPRKFAEAMPEGVIVEPLAQADEKDFALDADLANTNATLSAVRQRIIDLYSKL